MSEIRWKVVHRLIIFIPKGEVRDAERQIIHTRIEGIIKGEVGEEERKGEWLPC